eukprot:gene1008-25989_t
MRIPQQGPLPPRVLARAAVLRQRGPPAAEVERWRALLSMARVSEALRADGAAWTFARRAAVARAAAGVARALFFLFLVQASVRILPQSAGRRRSAAPCRDSTRCGGRPSVVREPCITTAAA